MVVQAACREGLGWTFGAKVRTENMPFMLVTLDVSKLSGWLNAPALTNIWRIVVTLEVSKLSGWLNADARCRESNGGHTVCGACCGLGDGGRRPKQRAGEGLTADSRQSTRRSAPGTCSPWS